MAAYDYIDATGVIVPDMQDTLAQVQAEFRVLIPEWANLDLSPETPQGVLCVAEALRRDAMARNNALLANQINPNIATGAWLDGLMALMGGQRHAATHSTLFSVEMTGRPSTLIPQGSIARDINGKEWRLLGAQIVPSGGMVMGDFQSVETGAIPCGVGELVQIASGVLGWEGVTNPTAAIAGSDVESDLKLRRRRERTLAAQGIETPESIVSALYGLPDVQSLSFWENYTNAPITHEGVTLVAHSVYLCIAGGNDTEIARTLKRVRGIGSGYNGNEVVTITDEITGQPYQVKFDRPTPVVLLLRVTVKASVVDAQFVVPELVMSWAQGETESDEGITVGRDISPFEIAAAINEQEPRLMITKMELSDDGGSTWTSDTKSILINEIASIGISSVQVVVV